MDDLPAFRPCARAAVPWVRSTSDFGPTLPLAPLCEDETHSFEPKGSRSGIVRLGSQSLLPTPSSPARSASPKCQRGPGLSLFLGNRCTKVHFVRHAEGFHNVITKKAAGTAATKAAVDKAAETARQNALAAGKRADEVEQLVDAAGKAKLREEENRPVHFATPGCDEYTDAELTEAGRNQCFALRGKIDRNRIVNPVDRLHVDLVVSSPLRRCLETADIIFGPGRTEGRQDLLPFLVHDLCRERYGEFSCDKRHAMSRTMKDARWSEWDWETQKDERAEDVLPSADKDEAWGQEREPEEHVRQRAHKFLYWLSSRPEREIAVVTHSSFLKCLFSVFGGETSRQDMETLRAIPANCELRTIVLCHHG